MQALGEQLQLVAVRVVRLAHRAPGRRVARRSCRCSRGLLLVVAVLQTFLAAVVVRRWRRRGEHQRGVREQDGLVEPASAEPRPWPTSVSPRCDGDDRRREQRKVAAEIATTEATISSTSLDMMLAARLDRCRLSVCPSNSNTLLVGGPSLRFSTCPRAGIRAGST